MDLKCLIHRPQVERFRARSANCPEARRARERLVAPCEHAVGRISAGNLRFGRLSAPGVH